VREAIQRLQTRGLVRTRTGSGSYALTPPAEGGDDWLQASGSAERSELHTFRTAIEQEAAALAARHRTSDDLATLDSALSRLSKATLPADTVEADFALHSAVALASHNRYLAEMLARLGATAIVLPHARLTEAVAATVIAEHRHIVEAIRSSDPVTASAAMRAHLAASQARRDEA
jgi:GntR family transcriptional repressor for pyruvate dehydrogenase complex